MLMLTLYDNKQTMLIIQRRRFNFRVGPSGQSARQRDADAVQL